MDQTMPELGTKQDLAEFLAVPVRTVEKWRYEGSGPRVVKIGRHVRYRREDVLAWLDEKLAS